MNPNLPTLYCDVDGVINVLSSKAEYSKSRVVKRQLPVLLNKLRLPVRFRWHEEVIRELASLPVNLIWLTTWNREAVEILEPLLGLKSNHVLIYNMKAHEIRNQKHKYDLLKLHQEENPTEFIWVDDVATQNYDAADWQPHHKRLIIKPNYRTGLTLEEIAKIKEFINPMR